MKLVAFQDPIFSTIQGEGRLVGMPSTFVRLWGCDYECSWCDTKESWRPLSRWDGFTPKEVAQKVLDLGNRHIVITGGNPLLQGDEVFELIDCLHGILDYPHVTIETQGSVAHRALRGANLISLSPKLERKPFSYVECLHKSLVPQHGFNEDHEIQIKVVVTSDDSAKQGIELCKSFRRGVKSTHGFLNERVHCYLQPEHSLGTSFVRRVCHILLNTTAGKSGDVSVLPQAHKTSLGVV